MTGITDGAMGHAIPAWREMFPDGRDIFYEGDDPEGFAATIRSEFGFDPAGPTWDNEHGWRFRCPPGHLDAIYGSGRFPMGS
jgi:hypothetical protein